MRKPAAPASRSLSSQRFMGRGWKPVAGTQAASPENLCAGLKRLCAGWQSVPCVSENLLRRQLQRLAPRPRVLVQTILYGVAAGLSAVVFQFGINTVYERIFPPLAKASVPVFLGGTLLAMLGTSLLVGFLLNSFCREAAGSGIPQLKVAFWKDFGAVPWRVAWVKLVAGILSVGGGSSLGREGPSVQLAGAVGSSVAAWLGEAKQARRPAAAAGAAAGLAAAFNTPLAAVTFVLEEIIGDLNSRFLGSILLASVIGALVVHGLVGPQPAFQLAPVSDWSWKVYALVPVIGAFASVVGVWFQRLSLGLRQRQRTFQRIPAWARPAVGAVLAWAIGVTVFLLTGRLGVFSLGYEDLSQALTDGLSWKLAGILLVGKFLATVLCYGLGGCGGIFSPTLFFGAMAALLLSGLTGLVTPLTGAEHIVFAVVGMSCCLGAVVRAPVTGVLIVFEMTHEFSLVPVLMLGALVSQVISRRMCAANFYDTILEQDGHQLERLLPPRNLRSWQEMPVSVVANFRPVVVESLEPAALASLLKSRPFRCFPVVQAGRLAGIVQRDELVAALAEARAPALDPAVTVLPGDSIRQAQRQLIEATAGLVVLTDGKANRLLGIFTLHDLLRAELESAERGGDDAGTFQ